MNNIKEVIKETEQYINDYVKQSGVSSVVLGISGGIDSAVVAHLLAYALDSDIEITLINMPYGKNNDSDILDLCNNLRMSYTTIRIDNIVDSYSLANGIPLRKLTKGNLMARVRMSILYMYANRYNGLVVGTTNLSEMVIGYYTKYGDGGVDFEPIGHITKTTLREMAKELRIPQSIIDKTPTAGLWDGQTDEKEMGFTYEQLDDYIANHMIISHNMPKVSDEEKIIHRRIEDMIKNSEHKKHMPPSLDVMR